MKYTSIIALATVNAVKMTALPELGGYEASSFPGPKNDPEDAWISVPKQDISVHDDHWGKDVQRVGHDDWLDGHV